MGDGSLVQVFREGRYVMRADQEGRIYVKPRGLGNFQVIADPSKDGDALSFSCQDLPRNK